MSLQHLPAEPIIIERIDVLDLDGHSLIRVRDRDGASGYSTPNQHLRYLYGILHELVIPRFLGGDAREVEALVAQVPRWGSTYKLAGLALWCPVGWVETAVLDLLGRRTGRRVAELLGGVLREEMPIYISSTRRDTTSEQEVEILAERLAATGATVAKLKVGGRMSANADASHGRSEALIELARRQLGDDIMLGADANGSYDVDHAIAMGRRLQDLRYTWFEEPCPFEDYAATVTVAEALDIAISAGEQDSSLWRFRDLATGVDIVQCDAIYVGGLLRARQVCAMAAAVNKSMLPHSPQGGAALLYALHLAAADATVGPWLEANAAWQSHPVVPDLKPRSGRIRLPSGHGFGLTVDEVAWSKAAVVM